MRLKLNVSHAERSAARQKRTEGLNRPEMWVGDKWLKPMPCPASITIRRRLPAAWIGIDLASPTSA